MRSALARAAAGVAAGWLVACGPPEGPQPVAFDREPCARCRMLISEPAFAAQLQTRAGEVESFDDPGCLLARLEEGRPQVHALWFHHLREERWIRGDAVAFVHVETTPMGYGLGAVDAATSGALSLDEARARVREREAARGAAP